MSEKSERKRLFRQYRKDIGSLSEADIETKWKQIADEKFMQDFYTWLERKAESDMARNRKRLKEQNRAKKTLTEELKHLNEKQKHLNERLDTSSQYGLEDIFSVALRTASERRKDSE